MYVLRFDGSFRSTNDFMRPSGFLGYGWLVYYQNILLGYGYGVALRGKDATSNVAEYLALIEGLEALHALHLTHQPISVVSDANVIVHRMNGYAGVETKRDRPLHKTVQELIKPLNIYSWKWIPRRYNKDADSLSRRGIHELYADQEDFQLALSRIEQDRKGEKNDLHFWDGMELIHRQDYLLYQAPQAETLFEQLVLNAQYTSSL